MKGLNDVGTFTDGFSHQSRIPSTVSWFLLLNSDNDELQLCLPSSIFIIDDLSVLCALGATQVIIPRVACWCQTVSARTAKCVLYVSYFVQPLPVIDSTTAMFTHAVHRKQ